MVYFILNGNDYSRYTNALKIKKQNKYNSQTNAAGDTVVDKINTKRVFEVGIIPIDEVVMSLLQSDLDEFNVKVSYRDPLTNKLVENVDCIIASHNIEYYTIQINKVMYKAFKLTFTEL